jgi:hypothetical protein
MAGLDPAIPRLRRDGTRKSWMPGSSPGMTTEFASASSFSNTASHSRNVFRVRVLPETFVPLTSEGAGNAGRSLRPQPCAQNKKAHKHSHHGHTGNIRHSPRNGFTACFVLFLVIGLFCHHPRRDALGIIGRLTPASGHQNHTTSPSAISAFVLCAVASTASPAQRP